MPRFCTNSTVHVSDHIAVPLLATLLGIVSHLMQETPTILLPQFTSSSVKSLLALMYIGQCYLSQECDMNELKHIMEAVGFKVGTGD